MRKFLIAAFAVTSLAFAGANLRAEDKPEEGKEAEGVKGILIDAKCGADTDEAKAADHKMACVLACEETGLGVFHEGKWIKFDEQGQKLAHDYISDKKNTSTKVHVAGKVSEDGTTIAVEAIHAQDEEKEGEAKEGEAKEGEEKEGEEKEGEKKEG